MVSEPTTRQMWPTLLTPWQGPEKIPACTWGRMLRNSLTLPVDKTLSIFIKKRQPSLVRPVLWDELGPRISSWYQSSSHKTSLTREGCSFFINMPKVLSTGNVGPFLNTLPHVQANIFPGPCHGVSSVGHICLVVGSNTMKRNGCSLDYFGSIILSIYNIDKYMRWVCSVHNNLHEMLWYYVRNES